MKSSGLELSNRRVLSCRRHHVSSSVRLIQPERGQAERDEPRGNDGSREEEAGDSVPVVPSHRRFSVLTEGSALKLLLTPETRRLFSPKESGREEGRGEPAESRRRIRICQSANATHPVPSIPSSPFSRFPFPVRVRVRSLNRPPFLSRGHGSARGTAKGDPVVSGAGSARSGQQRVRVLGGGCSGPDRDLGRSRLFSWTWIRDWRWRWRWSTSSHLSPPCRPIAFRPRRQFRPHLLTFSQSLLRPPARPLPPDRLVAHRHRSHQLGQAPRRGRRLRRRRCGLGLRQAAEEQAESRVSRLFFILFCCPVVRSADQTVADCSIFPLHGRIRPNDPIC